MEPFGFVTGQLTIQQNSSTGSTLAYCQLQDPICNSERCSEHMTKTTCSIQKDRNIEDKINCLAYPKKDENNTSLQQDLSNCNEEIALSSGQKRVQKKRMANSETKRHCLDSRVKDYRLRDHMCDSNSWLILRIPMTCYL